MAGKGPEGGGGGGPKKKGPGLRSVIVFLLLALALALGLGVVWVRTDSGARFIRGRLERMTGTELTVGAMRIGLPYDLVLREVSTVGFRLERGPGFKAEEIRIGLPWAGRWNVRVRGAVLRLAQSADGAWSPAFLAGLAGARDEVAARVSGLTAGFRGRATLNVTDSLAEWFGSKGDAAGAWNGITFEVGPVRVPRHVLYYHRLHIYSMERPHAERAYDWQREWLASEAGDCIALPREAPLAPPAAAARAPGAGKGEPDAAVERDASGRESER